MGPKPKSVPPRLGPPPQLTQLSASKLGGGKENRVGHKAKMIYQHQHRLQPKMREIFFKQAKLVCRWFHARLTWKKVLMSWMVMLAASKMVLLMLTYHFFTLTSLISLQIFHGVWTIAFFCLSVIETATILPNASCLLAGYLPATTVLHILLIPNDYPLEYIIVDAVGTFLAIITMFLMLRMECTEILHEAESMWNVNSDTTSESGLSSTSHSTSISNGVLEISTPQGRRIIGNPSGPTIINVAGYHNPYYDSMMMYNSMDEPLEASGVHSHQNPSDLRSHQQRGVANHVLFDEAVDLEPIDFEHFVDEPDINRNQSERMFQVTLGSSPPTRGR